MQRNPISTLLLLSALLVAACGGGQTAPADEAGEGPIGTSGTLPEPLESRFTTVTFLGTLHEAHLGVGYPLSTIEQTIRAFRPDVVLVELPPDSLADSLAEVDALGDAASRDTLTVPWLRDKPELYGVVLPLRHELGYEVLPVSGWTARAQADRDAYYIENPHGPMERQYVLANAAFHAAFLQNHGFSNVEWLHGAEYMHSLTEASRWLAYFAEEEMGAGGELHIQARHASLVQDAVAAFPRQRILVVFDATSRWYLEPAIASLRDVRLVPVTAFLP